MTQGAYFAVTGLWSILSIGTFMLVTGHKTDVWLVKTVGVLVLAIAATLLFAATRNRVSEEVRFLAVASAVAFILVDVTYVALRTISPIYALDAVAEILLVGAWLVPVKEPSTAAQNGSVKTQGVRP